MVHLKPASEMLGTRCFTVLNLSIGLSHFFAPLTQWICNMIEEGLVHRNARTFFCTRKGPEMIFKRSSEDPLETNLFESLDVFLGHIRIFLIPCTVPCERYFLFCVLGTLQSPYFSLYAMSSLNLSLKNFFLEALLRGTLSEPSV